LTRQSRDRRRLLIVAAVTALVTYGCGAPPVRDDNTLDARFAGPCERLIVAWRTRGESFESEASRLRERAGESGGELELHVVHCPGSRRREAPLRYAYTIIPVEADSVPLVVTSIPEDGWWAMTRLWADAETAGVLSAMGYDVAPAGIRFDSSGAAADGGIEVAIDAATGQFDIVAGMPGAERDVAEHRALVTDDDSAASAFFGPESASRANLGSFRLGASTLLAEVGISGGPERAVIDRRLTSERIFWRLPKP